MASITNRSRYLVRVKNRPDLTAHFSFSDFAGAQAYMQGLRRQRLEPRATRLDEKWLVRIRRNGFQPVSATFGSEAEARQYLAHVEEERSRGLFADYTASLKVTFAELVVRYLLEEAPKHKSRRILVYTLESWLADSGPAGTALLQSYREERARRGLPGRPAAFKMRRACTELAWLHKPFSKITTVDIERFIAARMQDVKPGTADRDLDRIKSIFKIATTVWDYPLAKNPIAAVRRPKYFDERDRRVTEAEEKRLLDALARLDAERCVEIRLAALASDAMAGQSFSSTSARKKVLAKTRSELQPEAAKTATVIPYLQVFYYFQVWTAARRGETLGLTWERVDFGAQTGFLPETKNGRARKLVLRSDLIALLKGLPHDTQHVFDLRVDYLVGTWDKACEMAGIDDLRIHDLRHEALSRLAESGKFTLPELQVVSGHRDIRMLMRYAHLCASRLAAKIDESFKDEAGAVIRDVRESPTAPAAAIGCASIASVPLSSTAAQTPGAEAGATILEFPQSRIVRIHPVPTIELARPRMLPLPPV